MFTTSTRPWGYKFRAELQDAVKSSHISLIPVVDGHDEADRELCVCVGGFLETAWSHPGGLELR